MFTTAETFFHNMDPAFDLGSAYVASFLSQVEKNQSKKKSKRHKHSDNSHSSANLKNCYNNVG